MSRKPIFLALSSFLMFILLLTGLQTAPRATFAAEPSATPDSDFPVAVETTGIIQSISANQIVLADGSAFKIDANTKLPKTALQPGMTVTVAAELDSEELVASSIRIGDGSDTSSTTGTEQPGKGNGKGNGNNDNKGGKGGKGAPVATDDASSGKGSGKGNGKGSGNGNNDNNGDKGGKGAPIANDDAATGKAR